MSNTCNRRRGRRRGERHQRWVTIFLGIKPWVRHTRDFTHCLQDATCPHHSRQQMKEVTLREEEVMGLSQRGLQPGSWRRDSSEGRSASTAEMERRACEDAGGQLLSDGQLCMDFWFWPPKEKLMPIVCVTVYEAHRSEKKGFCLVCFCSF